MTSNLDADRVQYAIENSLGGSQWGFYWGNLAWGDHEFDHLVVDGEDYPFEVVDVKSGSEGDWQTDTYIIVKVGDQYFRKNGYYASHDGSYWDGSFEEVKPAEKTIKVWE